MKILFVAMSESIHTARWVNQVTDSGWGVRLFDSTDSGQINPVLRNATVYQSMFGTQASLSPSIKRKGAWLPTGRTYAKRILNRWQPDYRLRRLAQLIQEFQPDIIHSLEFQHSSYLVLEARHWLQAQGVTNFPKWIVFNWGNDIYLFNRLAEHKARIHELLQTADYFDCDCERDVRLAKAIGMKAVSLPVLPVTGGFDLAHMLRLAGTEKPSARRIIAVKGYQHWQGRALFALRALALCADVLQDYKVVIFSAFPAEDISMAAELLAQEIGIPVEVMANGLPNDQILSLFAHSRIFLCTNISDGASIAMLEAMSLGAFPIQSNTACADEWITDGETGFIVPPEDPQIIATAIRRALTDDTLVDQAAELNAKTCAERLDATQIRQQVIDMYQSIVENRL
ncbi:MAG: glycosyltransferase [Anaerolineae bacterium]|nr:glycosyltransferase [Anaerolineae bacterium]